MDPCIGLLKRLVAIDSVNPALVPGAAGEGAIAKAIASELAARGLTVHLQQAAPQRPNVIGVLEGRSPGPSLMLCGHIDTVGVAEMAAPFEPREADGQMVGRGAQDMKSGVAAMIDAARVLAEAGGLAAGRLIIACVVDEEHASLGADALVREWHADAAVVTEPTDLAIATAHKGFEWMEVETRGRAAHGSRPLEGRDAILGMGRVLAALDRRDRALQAGSSHPLLGTGSLHASIITGGRELSSYPDRCMLQLERRTLPGDPAGVSVSELEHILAELHAADPDFEGACRPLLRRSAYECPAGHRLADLLADAARQRGLTAPRTGMSFWTDAAILGDAGIPSVLFGPVGGGLHSLEEWVDIGSVLACRDTLVELTRRWCQ